MLRASATVTLSLASRFGGTERIVGGKMQGELHEEGVIFDHALAFHRRIETRRTRGIIWDSIFG